jgi:MFS transporter, FHS family, Na+ dependent glucose transporter 1
MNSAAYYAAFVGLGLAAAVMGPTLPGLAEHTRSSLPQVSFLFTARSLGYLAGAVGGGRIYDRVAGHRLMPAALGLMAATVALAPAMRHLWLLFVVMLLLGLGEGAVDVGGNAMLVWVHGASVGPYMNALHLFFGLGTFLAPLIIAQVMLASGGISWAYWVIAVVYVPIALWVLRLPSPQPHRSSDASSAGEVRPLLVGLVAALFFLYVGSEVGFGGWIYTFALDSGIADATTAAYLTSLFWGAFTAGRVLSIPIATRVGPRSILLFDLLGCLVSVAVILLGQHSLLAVGIGTFGLGLAMASIFPTTISLAGRYMTLTGRVTGLFFIGSSTGGMILPWLMGQLIEPAGPRAAVVVVTVAIILATAVFGLMALYVHRQQPAA